MYFQNLQSDDDCLYSLPMYFFLCTSPRSDEGLCLDRRLTFSSSESVLGVRHFILYSLFFKVLHLRTLTQFVIN